MKSSGPYNIFAPGPSTGGKSDADNFCQLVKKGARKAVGKQYLTCQVNTQFGSGAVFVRYANVPAKAVHLELLNAQKSFHLNVGPFNEEGDMRSGKLKVEVMQKRGTKPRGKTGTPEQVIKHVINALKAAQR